jgi:hypothetical protein
MFVNSCQLNAVNVNSTLYLIQSVGKSLNFLALKPSQLSCQPCLCLCFFSLQMTNSTPLRLTILQFLQIFFTEACTFISLLPSKRAGPVEATRYYPLMRNKQIYRRTTPERP